MTDIVIPLCSGGTLYTSAFASVSPVSGDAKSVLPRDRPFHAALATLCIVFIAGTSGAKVLDLAVACLIVAFVLILSRTISR
jgi:hypothetical protein